MKRTATVSPPASTHAGFTLIEIMVVVAIMGMLAALVAHAVTDRADEARERTAAMNARLLADAVKMFYVDHSRLPDLDELTGGDGRKVYVENLPIDPWGNAYALRAGDRKGAFHIVSAGPDRVDGSEDDVTSQPQQPPAAR
jgi:general secretion pathway protein G